VKIALLGGTGNLGKGLAIRLAHSGYNVVVGSRDKNKATRKAKEYLNVVKNGKIGAEDNSEAALKCEIVIITVPWEHSLKLVQDLKLELEGKIVISPVVPLKRFGNYFIYDRPKGGSAAEEIARILRKSRIVSAYHTLPSRKISTLQKLPNWDVPICGDDDDSKKIVFEITKKMGFNPLDAGPLSNSYLVEALTPLILNLCSNNKLEGLGVKFI